MNEDLKFSTVLRGAAAAVAVLSTLCFVISGMQSLMRHWRGTPAYPPEYRDFEDWA